MARRDEFADVTKLASRLKARNAERAREGCFSSRQAESLSHATEVLGDSLPSSQ